MKPMNIGVIGCGNISGAYLGAAKQFPILSIARLADLDVSRAKAQAEKHGVPAAGTVDELLRDDSIELVINLTIPAVHAQVALQIIEAGKHMYVEKPLAVTVADGQKVLDAAKRKNVRVGCAPDTFLGTGHQTARHAIESGKIGRPIAALAFMLCGGHETWHPDPEFYYKPGGGPMFDMGPYYLTDLINLVGPIKRVCGVAGIQQPDRTITSKPKHGTKIAVQTPDHVAGTIEFAGGAIGTIVQSFAVKHAHTGGAPIQVIGTEGTILVPDPNGFEGDVKFKQDGMQDWEVLPTTHAYPTGRSLGVADMAHAIRSGREHRANGEQAFAVLDAMAGFLESSKTGKYHELRVDYKKPAMMPTDAADGVLDD